MTARKKVRYRTAFTDVITVLLTGALALATLDPVYDGRWYLVLGAIGLTSGILIGWLANWRGWMPVTAVVLAAVVLFAGAGPLLLPQTMTTGPTMGLFPSLATLYGVSDAAVGSWRGLLTTTPPVPAEGKLLMVPYLGGAIAGLVGVLLAGRTGLLAAPFLGPALLFLAGILLGTDEPVLPLLTGGGFAIVALIGTVARQNRADQVRRAGPGRARRWFQSVGIVGIAALAGSLAVFTPAAAGLENRFVLRDHVELPFDPSVYPSPLAGFRKYEVTQKRQVLFSVTGLPRESRMRLAVMDTYDGLVWKVAGGGGRHSTSGVFERVGARIPTETQGQSATVNITIRDLGNFWIPTVGSVTSVRFPGQRPELAESFRYNRVTGTGVLSQHEQLRAGDTVSFDAVVPPPVGPQHVAGRATEDVPLPFLEGVPDQVEAAVADWTSGVSGEYALLDTMVKRMREGGFSDGTAISGVQSWSGHSAGRVREFLGAGQLVGDAEQYAATFALMARQLGLPARVVLGVVPPSPDWTGGDVTGQMVSAWVEVRFAGAGWVPFDPTPPVTNVPKPPKPPAELEGATEVVHPPVVPELPPQQHPPLNAAEDTRSAQRTVCLWCRTLITVLTFALPPLLLIFAICGFLLFLKMRRRRRRRNTGSARQRVASGWLELLDGMRDYRVPVADGLTRQETVRNLHLLPADLLGQSHKDAARSLARRADEAVFGPDDVLTAHGIFWSDVDRALRALGSSRPWWRRIVAALNPITLLPAARR